MAVVVADLHDLVARAVALAGSRVDGGSYGLVERLDAGTATVSRGQHPKPKEAILLVGFLRVPNREG